MKLIPRSKTIMLIGLIALYLLLGGAFYGLVETGVISQLPPTPKDHTGIDVVVELSAVELPERLQSAQDFVDEKLVRSDGHVKLYYLTPGATFDHAESTNSEAMSYYLLWKAQIGDKEGFDNGLDFIEEYMIHPELDYLMWRIEPDGTVVDDGVNIASDADLRAIKALVMAEERWGDLRYTRFIDTLAVGLENVAVTKNGLLAPYGGGEKGNTWTANEVWLSYEDFTVFHELALRRGEPWKSMYVDMRDLTLASQIKNGLYNSEFTFKGDFGNTIDGDGYGINSMWIMVRCAESTDPALRESARKSLDFYKQKFVIDAQLFSLYSANGDALAGYDAPWVYALVARAAVALNDEAFADIMMQKLIEFQVQDPESPLHGAILEAGVKDRVGQFVMQESIITGQDYLVMKEGFKEEK